MVYHEGCEHPNVPLHSGSPVTKTTLIEGGQWGRTALIKEGHGKANYFLSGGTQGEEKKFSGGREVNPTQHGSTNQELLDMASGGGQRDIHKRLMCGFSRKLGHND